VVELQTVTVHRWLPDRPWPVSAGGRLRRRSSPDGASRPGERPSARAPNRSRRGPTGPRP